MESSPLALHCIIGGNTEGTTDPIANASQSDAQMLSTNRVGPYFLYNFGPINRCSFTTLFHSRYLSTVLLILELLFKLATTFAGAARFVSYAMLETLQTCIWRWQNYTWAAWD